MIDLNPVKAGIVSGIDALAYYEWGSYHDACAGAREAIAGYDRIYRGRGRAWGELKACVQVDEEGRGGDEMMTVSLRPYHKGLADSSRTVTDDAI